MFNNNGGYITIKVEASKQCVDEILKWYGKRPIRLSFDNGNVTRLQDAVELGTYTEGEGRYALLLTTDAGMFRIVYYIFDGENYSWIVESLLPKVFGVDDLGLDADHLVKTYTFTGMETKFEYFNAITTGSVKAIKDLSGEYGIVIGSKNASYKNSDGTYSGCIVYANDLGKVNLFVGTNFLITGKEYICAILDDDLIDTTVE